jgi:hypothetical protein
MEEALMDHLDQLASAGLALIFVAAVMAIAHSYIQARSAKYTINDPATFAVLELSHQLRALPRSL